MIHTNIKYKINKNNTKQNRNKKLFMHRMGKNEYTISIKLQLILVSLLESKIKNTPARTSLHSVSITVQNSRF